MIARHKLYVWLVPLLAGIIFLVVILVWLLPFFNTVRLNAEKYQLLLAEKVADDIETATDFNKLWQYLSRIKVGEQGFIYVVDRFGRLVFYSPNFLTVKEKSLGVSSPVSGFGWRVVVGVPLSEALREQYVALAVAFLTCLIGLLFIILLIIVIQKLSRGDHRRPFHLLLHKVRAPLTSVKWNLHSLLAGDWGAMNDQQRKFLERSYDANQQMIKLAEELADSATLEGDHLFDFTKNDVVGLVEEVVGDFNTEAKRANVKIIFEKPIVTMPQLVIDRKKIKLALTKILDNAIRYNLSSGRVLVKILKEKGTVVIKFIDTGIGIPVAQQARIFKKFFRTVQATQIQSAGFGLGLYIAKLIIKGHCGKILVESQEHIGSTFSVILPI